MKMIARSLLLALPLFCAQHALAQHKTFQVSADASTVSFTLGGADHGTQGTFHVQNGAVDFDLHNNISGAVVVAAGSGKTGNNSRDKKMTNEVLQATNFAEISFWPKAYTGTLNEMGDSTIQVSGVFTLHGTPHDITVPMQIHIDGDNCTAKTQFTVPYVKWGLKDPSIFILKVAKEVLVDVTLSGKLAASR